MRRRDQARKQRTPALAARRPISRLVAAAAVAVLAIVGHLAQLGHLVLVSHAICEHGALVHETPAEIAAAAAHAAERRAERAMELRDPRHAHDAALHPGDGGDGEHGHCDPFALRSSAVLTTPFCADATLLEASLLPWSVRPRHAERAIGILDLAPKSSPPV